MPRQSCAKLPRTPQLEGRSRYPPGCRLPKTCLAFVCELPGGRDLESLLRLLKRIYDCAIQSTVLALVPMREEDVSWFPTLAWQQCSTLPCGTQACSRCSVALGWTPEIDAKENSTHGRVQPRECANIICNSFKSPTVNVEWGTGALGVTQGVSQPHPSSLKGWEDNFFLVLK